MKTSNNDSMFKDFQQSLFKCQSETDHNINLSLIVNRQLVFINNQIDQDIIFTPKQKIPFPSEPFSVKYNQNQSCPLYFIDFTKILTNQIDSELLQQKFEVDSNTEFYAKCFQIFSDHKELQILQFPVFHKNQQKVKIAFGVLKMSVQKERKFSIQFIVLPYNFPLFLQVYEGIQNAVRNEKYIDNCSSKNIENYYSQVPFYYQPYFKEYFGKMNLNFLIKSEGFFENYNNTNILVLGEEYQQIHHHLCSQYMEIHKKREKNQKLHENRKNTSCCSGLGQSKISSMFKDSSENAMQEYLELEKKLIQMNMIDNQNQNKYLRNASQKKMNEQVENQIKQKFKDPYIERELEYRKECEPFGNPFKLIKIKNHHDEIKSEMNSDAYLTSLNQKKKHTDQSKKRCQSYDLILNAELTEISQKKVKLENQQTNDTSSSQEQKEFIVDGQPPENVVFEFLLENREKLDQLITLKRKKKDGSQIIQQLKSQKIDDIVDSELQRFLGNLKSRYG